MQDQRFSAQAPGKTTQMPARMPPSPPPHTPARTFLGFLRCTFFFLKRGRKRSQFSSANAGSLASSRLIISVLMW